jgi:uncharacterized protein YcaQ
VSVRSLTWSDVWRRRLANHSLLEAAPRRQLLRVVGAVCGIHAQMMASAEISIGLRVEGMTKSKVRDELWKRKRLVKTYGLRGTVHLFPASELGLWLAALRAAPTPNQDSRLAGMGLTQKQVDSIADAIGEVLDGQRLTTEQLEDEVAAGLGPWTRKATPAFSGAWSRTRMSIGVAAHAGTLCFGPNDGNKVTFVRPEQWIGPVPEVDGGEALREVVRRFLMAYGPATPGDFAQWFYTTPSGAREVFRSMGNQLQEVDVEGWRAWLPMTDTNSPSRAKLPIRLLPHFDCYLVGCRPRDNLVPKRVQEQTAERRLKRQDLHSPLPILLIDGVVGGLWERRLARGVVTIRVEPFGKLDARQTRELRAEAERIGEILEAEVDLSIGSVGARPHL